MRRSRKRSSAYSGCSRVRAPRNRGMEPQRLGLRVRDVLSRPRIALRRPFDQGQCGPGQPPAHREAASGRGPRAGLRRRAVLVPHAVVPAHRLARRLRGGPLCRRGGRRARQDLDVARDALPQGDVLGKSAGRRGASRAAPQGAREVLHREFGQDRSARRAMLKLDRHGGVARVTLDRPELRNAFDDVLIGRLTAAFEELQADASVRVVVLAGNGPAFCAGADLNWMKRMAGYGFEENLADARALAAMLATLDRLPKPTIARVHGPVFAGGTGLVAACDIAVGTPEAKFCLSEAKLGLSPATISPYVMRAMGERMARRYFLTAEVFGAEEAYRIGLLSALVAPAELDTTVEDFVKHLLAGGPEAQAKIKDL